MPAGFCARLCDTSSPSVVTFCLQGNMAAAAAALANSLGAASCGMGSPGAPQSNPLLGYAALLGMGRNPNGGPGKSLHDHCCLVKDDWGGAVVGLVCGFVSAGLSCDTRQVLAVLPRTACLA